MPRNWINDIATCYGMSSTLKCYTDNKFGTLPGKKYDAWVDWVITDGRKDTVIKMRPSGFLLGSHTLLCL